MSAEIKVDPIGQLRLFRSNTFVDPYCFIREAIQNAQRAKATEVRIHLTGSELIIEDNGIGLDDIESILTIAKTGWDSDTVESEDPFGIGFFAAFAMADQVEITSKNHQLKLDYPTLLKDPTQVYSTTLEPSEDLKDSGFTVRLTDFVTGVARYTTEGRIKEVASTIPGLSIYLDDKLLPSYSVLNPPDETHILVENKKDGYLGWIAPSLYSWDREVKIYHKDRFVQTMELSGLKGCIQVELNTLSLRAPDRQAIIKDDKYNQFKTELTDMYIKPLMLKALQSGTKSRSLTDIVANYLEPKDYAPVMLYQRLNGLEVLSKAAKLSENDLISLGRNDFEDLFAESMENGTFETLEQEMERTEVSRSTFSPPSEVVHSYSPAPSIETQDKSAVETADKKKVKFKTAQKMSTKDTIYYAEPLDLKNKDELISQLILANKTVFVVQNKLESDSLREVLGAVYVGRAQIETKILFNYRPKPATIQVQRVSSLLRVLITAIGATRANFKIPEIVSGVVSKTTIKTLLENEISSVVENPTFGRVDELLVINTGVVNKSRVLTSADKRADISELLFLMGHIDDLAECLGVSASLLCSTLASLKLSWIVTNHQAEVEV